MSTEAFYQALTALKNFWASILSACNILGDSEVKPELNPSRLKGITRKHPGDKSLIRKGRGGGVGFLACNFSFT